MGQSLILLIIVLTAIYFVAQKFGWDNLLRTLLNPAQAQFVRRDISDGSAVTFAVTPARSSWAYLVIMGGILLGSLWLLSVLGVGVLVPVLALFGVPLYLYPLLKNVAYRKAVIINISTTGELTTELHVKGWNLVEIEEIIIERGVSVNDEPVEVQVLYTPTNNIYIGKATETLIGRALGQRQAARSYLLTAKVRGLKQSMTLCGGLTLDCARQLRNDLNAVINSLR
jgi:hypothetical protein